MARTYGTTFKPQPIYSDSVGETRPNNTDGWTTPIRILTTILEIGAALIPGIGVVAETGVALAAGIVNQVLDVETGSANAIGTVLNFGVPLLGGAVAGARNARQVGKAIGNLPEGAIGFLDAPLPSAFQAFDKGLTTQLGEQLGSTVFEMAGVVADSAPTLLTEAERLLELSNAYRIGNVGFKVSDNAFSGVTEDARYRKAIQSIARNSKDVDMLLLALNRAENSAQRSAIIRAYINDLEVLDQGRYIRQLANRIDDEAKSILAITPEHLNDIIATSKRVSTELHVIANSIEREQSTWSKIVKFSQSRKANDIVQTVQAIFDANDLGRAPVELAYRRLKKYFGDIIKKLPRAAKLANHIREIKTAFEKSGGVTVESEWHLGYKIIQSLGTTNLVQISYFKNSKSMAGGGIRHVIVFATNHQLKLYRASPGRMYRNTWALSKGKKVSLGALANIPNVSSKDTLSLVETVLGFLPIGAMRNWLSLTSNVVENVSDMLKGDWSKEWAGKFKKSFRNTAVSRTFRLIAVTSGKYLARATGKRLYNYIFKEIQRNMTTIVANGIKRKLDGKKFSTSVPKQLGTNVLMGIRTNTLRKARGRSNSVVVNSLSARRKLETVKRVPNAVTPGRPFKGFKY